MKYFYSTAGMTDASIICFLPVFFESSNAHIFLSKLYYVYEKKANQHNSNATEFPSQTTWSFLGSFSVDKQEFSSNSWRLAIK